VPGTQPFPLNIANESDAGQTASNSFWVRAAANAATHLEKRPIGNKSMDDQHLRRLFTSALMFGWRKELELNT